MASAIQQILRQVAAARRSEEEWFVLPDEGDEHRHGSFLSLEPVTGRVLDFAFRAQINALVRETTVVTALGNSVRQLL